MVHRQSGRGAGRQGPADQGFALEGGRLDYIDHQNTAALVYLRNQHLINVFVWRAEGKDRPPVFLERQGYHLIHWTKTSGRSGWCPT